ncbi:MAG: Holliday junction branch migration DNA helicase RuvB [Chlamydiae bacterium]|nr:Holliday junction branch migration DNA helicase RuvB [Chlamydiota bacterium]
MANEDYIRSSWNKKEEPNLDLSLRPQTLDDFFGQPHLRKKLEVFIGAALKRGESLGHCLFYGPPGLGKTTLALIIAKMMGTNLITTSGPTIEKPGDLAGILTSLKEGDVLLIDELHRLNRSIEEYLYPPMEDFKLDLIIDSGPSSRSVQIKLNRFTLVGASTQIGLISSPLRSRFPFHHRLDYYDAQTLEEIILRSAKILQISIEIKAAFEIARRSRGTPRIANNLLRWVRDFSQMQSKKSIDEEVTKLALEMLAIDQCGLDELDKKLLSLLIDHYDGGPVGLNTLAVAIGEQPLTIAEVFEPYLIMQGFIKRTARGREATKLAYRHLGKPLPTKKGEEP